MYDWLRYAHLHHHAIVQAHENGEGTRVAALMYEHACVAKTSINMTRSASRFAADNVEASLLARGNGNLSGV